MYVTGHKRKQKQDSRACNESRAIHAGQTQYCQTSLSWWKFYWQPPPLLSIKKEVIYTIAKNTL